MNNTASKSRQRVFDIFALLLFFTATSIQALAGPARIGASIVTGANGYVGREVVKVLLEQKQPIYCLVRDHRVASEQEYWASNDGNVFVKVMPYDMLDDGESLTSALEQACNQLNDDEDDCVCVYHIASVFGPTSDHVQTAKDNVRGSENIVKAMSKFSNSRLVLTSSTAAVRGTGQDPVNGKYYSHLDWNTKSKLGDNWGSSYQWSKAESERRAWELAKEYNVPMASICPSFVFGPPTSKNHLSSSYSFDVVGSWVRGEAEVQSRLCVDIRDVARAQVAASEKGMGERFIVSTEARIPSKDIAETLKRVWSETQSEEAPEITYDSKFTGGAIPIGAQEVEATKRLQEKLGITLRPVEETIFDMGRALLDAAKE